MLSCLLFVKRLQKFIVYFIGKRMDLLEIEWIFIFRKVANCIFPYGKFIDFGKIDAIQFGKTIVSRTCSRV